MPYLAISSSTRSMGLPTTSSCPQLSRPTCLFGTRIPTWKCQIIIIKTIPRRHKACYTLNPLKDAIDSKPPPTTIRGLLLSISISGGEFSFAIRKTRLATLIWKIPLAEGHRSSNCGELQPYPLTMALITGTENSDAQGTPRQALPCRQSRAAVCLTLY